MVIICNQGCNKDSIFTETLYMKFLDIIWNYEKLDGLYCNAVHSVAPFQTLSAADLRDSEISGLIATKMKEFHDLQMPGPKSVCLWDRLRYARLSWDLPRLLCSLSWLAKASFLYVSAIGLRRLNVCLHQRKPKLSTWISWKMKY